SSRAASPTTSRTAVDAASSPSASPVGSKSPTQGPEGPVKTKTPSPNSKSSSSSQSKSKSASTGSHLTPKLGFSVLDILQLPSKAAISPSSQAASPKSAKDSKSSKPKSSSSPS